MFQARTDSNHLVGNQKIKGGVLTPPFIFYNVDSQSILNRIHSKCGQTYRFQAELITRVVYMPSVPRPRALIRLV